ncbi:LysR substrate-binding domain-containing protein [Polynucleobacter antarcticus]|uniref:LysR family transcriptional regulator n=1 Tax=Polynucleobacter antarcticus TaxID=1743162 RepID=A0A6M9PVQ1_9BURK|nr:LysR substrate-binding domain-containing protein [Polynucleobacter antarcticus]QKM63508.1 LysR family transcriptional regulator [Polynucleobacter antarcticus]
MRRIPNFVLLRAFEAAARLESFTLAAHELSLTQSAISHQIKELEGYFGRALFIRRNRGVEPNLEGKRLLESLSRVFDVIQDACSEVSSASTSQVLALYCPPSLAVNWLGPRLPDFFKTYPNITIRMTSGSEPADLNQAKELDIAIAYGMPPKRPGISVISLGLERIAPLCSPTLLTKRLSARVALIDLPLIDSQLSRVMWPSWFTLNSMELPNKPRSSFDRAALVIAAAVDGLGVALESTRLAERALIKGELVEIGAEEFIPIEQETHFIYCRSSECNLEKVKVFQDWLLGMI